MIESWLPDGDFDQVIDTLEPVSWLRRRGGDAVSLQAWRFSDSETPYPGAAPGVSIIEVVWQLPATDADCMVAVGDTLTGPRGARSRVARVGRLRGGTRLRATTQRLDIKPDSVRRVRVEEPVLGGGPDGEAIVGWRLRHASVQAAPLVDSSTPTWLLVGDLVTVAGDRLVTASGEAFRFLNVTQSQSVDDAIEVSVEAAA